MATEKEKDRDLVLAEMDHSQLQDRMVEAFDRFIALGFEVHLIGVVVRSVVEYRLTLEPDGGGEMNIRQIIEAADQYRLDLIVDKTMGLVLYPKP